MTEAKGMPTVVVCTVSTPPTQADACMGFVKEPDYAPTELENLNGARARRHFLCIYIAIALGTLLSFYNYTAMWECSNMCGAEGEDCYSNSTACHENTTVVDYGPDLGRVYHIQYLADLNHLHWLNRFTHITVVIHPRAADTDGADTAPRELTPPGTSEGAGRAVTELAGGGGGGAPVGADGDETAAEGDPTAAAEGSKHPKAIGGYGMLRVSQTVWTQLSPNPEARSDVVDLSHCTRGGGARAGPCMSEPIRVLPGSLSRLALTLSHSDGGRDAKWVKDAWAAAHPDTELPASQGGVEEGEVDTITPVAPAEEDMDTSTSTRLTADDIGIVLEFQSGYYTAVDILARALLIAVSGIVYSDFRQRMLSTAGPATPEQEWAALLLLALVVYVNPLSIVSALVVFEKTIGLVFEFVEFHAATYFTILIQYMYISIFTEMYGGMQGCWKKLWLVWAWLMVCADFFVAVFVKGPSLDYTSTFVGWVLNTKVQHLSPILAAFYVVGLVLFAIWLIGAFATTRWLKKWLRMAPYGPTRRKQLTFRSVVFIVWAYALSRTACVVLYWLVVGKTRQAYRSADELGAVLMCSVLTFSLVYQFSPSAPRSLDAPPPPSDPSWEAPRWRHLVWSTKWYKWLEVHGGTLYHFITENEAEKFEALQELQPVDLVLMSCTASEWPIRSSPSHDGFVIRGMMVGDEVRSVRVDDTWHQLPDGNYFSLDESLANCHGVWREAEPDTGSLQSSFYEPETNVSTLLEGAQKPRLFFCVETAARLADICYASYYPPGEDDFRLAVPRGESSFGWNLIVQKCAIAAVALAGAIGAVGTGLERSVSPLAAAATRGSLTRVPSLRSSRSNSPQLQLPHPSPGVGPAPLHTPPTLLPLTAAARALPNRDSHSNASFHSGGAASANSGRVASAADLPDMAVLTSGDEAAGEHGGGARLGTSPLLSPGGSGGAASAAAYDAESPAPTADLASLKMRLFDVVELSGTRVFITVPADGSHAVYVAFRGSDLRFSNANLVSDLRYTRRVWRTMTEGVMQARQGPASMGGCCGQPILHRGFMDMWEKARGGHNLNGPLQSIPLRDVVLGTVDKALQSFGCPLTDIKVYSTGHSLGAALACIFAYSLKRRRGVDSIVYTYGQPKLGNYAFKALYESFVPNTFRVVFEYDPVVHVSGTFCNYHVGREVCVDRHGMLLVEPTWVEKTFQPTKTLAVGDMGGHGLGSYCTALNRVFLRAGCATRCYYPRAAQDTPRGAVPPSGVAAAGESPLSPDIDDVLQDDAEMLLVDEARVLDDPDMV